MDADQKEPVIPSVADSPETKVEPQPELASVSNGEVPVEPAPEDEAEEINKIMNEIKELQQEIETEEEPAVRSEVIHVAPPPAKPAPQDRTVRQLSEVRAEKMTAKSVEGEETESNALESGGELTMSIRGNLTLKLNYGVDQCVSVSFKSDELAFRLSDGAEFKLPIQMNQHKNMRKVS